MVTFLTHMRKVHGSILGWDTGEISGTTQAFQTKQKQTPWPESTSEQHGFIYHTEHRLVLEIESVVDKALFLLPGRSVLWRRSNAHWLNSSLSPDLKWLGIFRNPFGSFRRGNWRKQTNSGLWTQECVNSNISGALFCGVYKSYNANRYFGTAF
jgi:hypothetical protein